MSDLSAADLEAAEWAMRRAVEHPRRMFVRVQKDGAQNLVANVPDLLAALSAGWTIHPADR